MNPSCEAIKLILPKRRTPLGSFYVSDDGEFLFIFKDTVGIYDPYPKLVNELTADRPGHFDCNMRYFDVSEVDSFAFPVKLVDRDQTPQSDVLSVIFSCCDRSSQSVESVEYRNHLYRNAEWSPTGVDQMSRSIFSCVTSDYQLYIAFRVGDSWSGKICLSESWFAFWRSQGVSFLSESWRSFFEIPNDYTESGFSDEVIFETLNEYLSFVEDVSFLQSTWSKKIRIAERPKSSMQGSSNALLTALHKSGTISFWDVSVPIVNRDSVRLVSFDRTYFCAFCSSLQPSNPNFIRIADIDTENFFIVIGFPNGKIVCAFYQAYAKQMGLLSVLRRGQCELCKCSSDQKPIAAVCFKNGILAIAKGTRVYLTEVFNHASVKPICSISSDDIIKPITGVCFHDTQLYISSKDAIIAKSTIPTLTKKKYEVTIINQSPPTGGNYYHRYYSGLHISPNGVHATFLEGTVAPTYCDIPTNLVFLPLMKNLDIIRSADTLKGPMRNNVDCLEEVNRLLQFFDLSTMTFPGHIKGKYELHLENDNVTDQIIAFFKDLILNPTVDISKMELHKIQFRRAITMLTLKDVSKGPEIKRKLKAQIDLYNRILALRQIDHCYRLFLKTEIQRQAQDCVLILRIATLCRRYFDSNPDILKEALELCGILQRATGTVIKIAEQLLTKRFKRDVVRPSCQLWILPTISVRPVRYTLQSFQIALLSGERKLTASFVPTAVCVWKR
nr:gtpase activating protein gyp2 [Hymenolepis microstoma]